jgi:hypothetical protein
MRSRWVAVCVHPRPSGANGEHPADIEGHREGGEGKIVHSHGDSVAVDETPPVGATAT